MHRIIPAILKYIMYNRKKIQDENALLKEDQNLLIEILDELTCKIPIEQQAYYIKELLMPVYADSLELFGEVIVVFIIHKC